jgi:hypothetical protein
VDVADIPVMIMVGHVEGRRAARGSDVATRGGGSATQRHSLATCHPVGTPARGQKKKTSSLVKRGGVGREFSLLNRSQGRVPQTDVF